MNTGYQHLTGGRIDQPWLNLNAWRRFWWLLATAVLLFAGLAHADISSIMTFPEGTNGEVQYESNGLFAGDSTFTFDPATNILTVYRVDGSSAVISGNLRLSYLNCSAYSNGGTLTTDALGNVVCANDDSGAGGASAGGLDTQVQYNNSGSFDGSSGLTYNSTTQHLTVGSSITIGGIRVGLRVGVARLFISSSTEINGEIIIGGVGGGSNSGTVTLQDSSGNNIHQLSTISNPVTFNQDHGTRDFQVGTAGSTQTFFINGSSNTVGVGTTRTTNTFNVDGNAGIYSAKEQRWYDSDNTNYIALRASDTVSTDIAFKIGGDGTNGQALFTDGAGNLFFTDISAPQSNLGVEEDDVEVSSPTAAVDFLGLDFDVTESPAGEANIALSTTSTKYIQNTGTPTTATQVFKVSSGTVTGQLTVSGVINAAGGVTCTDCIALQTETSGNYVASLTEGLAIDVGLAGEAATPQVTFDPTEFTGNRTWGDGSTATMAWTFNLTSGDPTITLGNNRITISSMTLNHLKATTTALNGVHYSWPSSQGSANRLLSNNGSGTLSWAQVGLTNGVTGTLPAANGGTGLTSPATNTIMIGNGSTWVSTSIPNCGASGKLLFSSTTKKFTCGTDATGASPILAISSGTTVVSSPTVQVDFSSHNFIVQLVGTTSAYVTLNPAIVSLLGPSIGLGTETTGDYVSSITVSAPLTGNTSGHVTLGLNQGVGTDITGDVEEETHVTEHQNGGADELAVAGLSGLLDDPQKVVVSTGGSVVHTSSGINFIPGSNIAITGAANGAYTDITIASGGGGYAMEPATVTIQANRGISVSTTVTHIGPKPNLLQLQNTFVWSGSHIFNNRYYVRHDTQTFVGYTGSQFYNVVEALSGGGKTYAIGITSGTSGATFTGISIFGDNIASEGVAFRGYGSPRTDKLFGQISSQGLRLGYADQGFIFHDYSTGYDIILKSSATIASDFTWTLPSNYEISGYWKTDSSGNLTVSSVSWDHLTDIPAGLGDGADHFSVTLSTWYVSPNWAGDTFPVWQAPRDYAITITSITATALSASASSVTFNLEERAFDSLNSAGTDVFTVAEATANVTGCLYTTPAFANADIAAGSYLVWDTDQAATGVVAKGVILTVYYKRQ